MTNEPVFRFTVAQYHEMIDRAILTENDPVELIEGWLITKMPKNPPHAVATDLTADKLDQVKPAGWSVKRQDPITTQDSEPEPDVALVRGQRRDYISGHPGPGDIALIVEVADSTLERDQTLKKRAYARAGIVAYWIVNLIDRQVEVYTDPSGPGDKPTYLTREVRSKNESVALRVEGVDIASIAVAEFLP